MGMRLPFPPSVPHLREKSFSLGEDPSHHRRYSTAREKRPFHNPTQIYGHNTYYSSSAFAPASFLPV
jgi:hypothetical protein